MRKASGCRWTSAFLLSVSWRIWIVRFGGTTRGEGGEEAERSQLDRSDGSVQRSAACESIIVTDQRSKASVHWMAVVEYLNKPSD